MKIYSHLIDYLLSAQNNATKLDYKAWLKQAYRDDSPERKGQYLSWYASSYGGMHIYAKWFKWVKAKNYTRGPGGWPVLTDEQFMEGYEHIRLLEKRKQEIWEQWIKEPGIHLFIAIPRQIKPFEEWLEKRNLTDKIIFKSKPLWNTHYKNANHALVFYVLEQK